MEDVSGDLEVGPVRTEAPPCPAFEVGDTDNQAALRPQKISRSLQTGSRIQRVLEVVVHRHNIECALRKRDTKKVADRHRQASPPNQLGGAGGEVDPHHLETSAGHQGHVLACATPDVQQSSGPHGIRRSRTESFLGREEESM